MKLHVNLMNYRFLGINLKFPGENEAKCSVFVVSFNGSVL